MLYAENRAAIRKRLGSLGLLIGAIGVVYGDIGTSPLYAINEIFFGHKDVPLYPELILGSISLVLWSINLIIALKYLIFVLRADSDGEGGVFALYSRVHNHKKGLVGTLRIVLMLAAGLLLGASIITPAISVLSAVEGVAVRNSYLGKWVIPLTLGILLLLFSIQRRGTSKVGRLFGPIGLAWFLAIGSIGLFQLIQTPEILSAFNPMYGIRLLMHQSVHNSLILLGAVMLAVTGGESVFADMGHFGRGPIRIGWFALVYPALLLNYLGQGAYLLRGAPVLNRNVFYSAVPESIIFPMAILAMAAAVVASQALISGSFSLLSQAIGLGLFPRLKVVHTHEEHAGQIFLPFLNFFLFVGSTSLVLIFRSSNALASAYGLAVAGVMFGTSLSMIAVAIYHWKWSRLRSFLFFGLFVVIDIVFLMANTLRFFEGGFIPLTIGIIFFTIMWIWRWGRKTTFQAYSSQKTMTMQELVELKKSSPVSINRNMVFMVPKPLKEPGDNSPALVQFYLDRYQYLPKNLFLVEVVHRKVPYVHGKRYSSVEFYKSQDKGCIISVALQFGFMEDPNVEATLEDLAAHHEIDLPHNPDNWLVHVGHEYLIMPKNISWERRFRFHIFFFLRQITQPGYYHYGLGRAIKLSLDIMPVEVR